MSSAARIGVLEDWQLLENEGFTLRVDRERQSPLAFALSVAQGLVGRPRRLESSFLYDAVGSSLFERITEQPEYYLTLAEDRLLREHAQEIRRLVGNSSLVELGSGASQKTQRLLDAWLAAGPTTYVRVDVDAGASEQASQKLIDRYRSRGQLAIRGVAATYQRALTLLSGSEPMTVAFLGSSLGNLGWDEYPMFCEFVASSLRGGDHFLVGVDLVKSPARLEAAYNDAAGVTAAFTRNLFARMNRELGTRIPEHAIEHIAYYDDERERIEIFAEAREEISFHVPALGRRFRIARGERIQTEVSHKFRAESFVATVERFGLRAVWQGLGNGDFGLFLFRKSKGPQLLKAPRNHEPERLAELHAARVRTLEIVSGLSESDLSTQHSVLMSPLAWDLGHIAAFEEQWLLPASAHASPEVIALYDAMATPRRDRAKLALPPVSAVFERLNCVRQLVEQHFARAGSERASSTLPASDYSLPLVIQHELQHQETMLQAIALREDLPYRPRFLEPRHVTAPADLHVERILIPGGPFLMGTNDRAWAYDNERPAHQRDVASFLLDRAPVSNAAFAAFIFDGGYLRRELWTEAGWAWLEQNHCTGPAHWKVAGSTNPRSLADFRACVFGHLEPLAPSGIVSHVSWYEADAYARWAGGRLPTEAEWEKAAAWDAVSQRSRRFPWGDAAWDHSRANLGQARLEPVSAHAYPAGESAYGCLQMLGDVWEWTDTWFDGYPGFEAFPYREYSEVFFGQEYRVLRGGSFATHPLVARTTFRNWDYPQRRQIFAGFRCAWSA